MENYKCTNCGVSHSIYPPGPCYYCNQTGTIIHTGKKDEAERKRQSERKRNSKAKNNQTTSKESSDTLTTIAGFIAFLVVALYAYDQGELGGIESLIAGAIVGVIVKYVIKLVLILALAYFGYEIFLNS